MRIGIVCPYTWNVPGGVQQHVRDLAETLIDLGHRVSVISAADDDVPAFASAGARIGSAVYRAGIRCGGKTGQHCCT